MTPRCVNSRGRGPTERFFSVGTPTVANIRAGIITHRKCTRCHKDLLCTKEFFHYSSKSKDLCLSRCKSCWSEIRSPGKRTFAEIFWASVDRSGGASACWEWRGPRHYLGYGCFGKSKKHERYAHRFAWEDRFGPIPEGAEVCHECDNPPCCNPEHLKLGSHQENMMGMLRRNRFPDRRGILATTVRLKENEVIAIRERAHSRESRIKIAADYGISKSTVSSIYWRRSWSHLHGGPLPTR